VRKPDLGVVFAGRSIPMRRIVGSPREHRRSHRPRLRSLGVRRRGCGGSVNVGKRRFVRVPSFRFGALRSGCGPQTLGLVHPERFAKDGGRRFPGPRQMLSCRRSPWRCGAGRRWATLERSPERATLQRRSTGTTPLGRHRESISMQLRPECWEWPHAEGSPPAWRKHLPGSAEPLGLGALTANFGIRQTPSRVRLGGRTYPERGRAGQGRRIRGVGRGPAKRFSRRDGLKLIGGSELGNGPGG